MSRTYVCSAVPGCKQSFAKYTELKRHEAAHSAAAYTCTWPGCDFVTLTKYSYEIHSAKHAGEQRCVCPHDDCDYKTHNPSHLTRHRKTRHGYVPTSKYCVLQSSSQPLPSGSSHQHQPQPMQPQPMSSRPMQSHPTQYQSPPPIYSQSLGVLYGSTDTADDYTMYTGAARGPNGWSEGCMCPELMERRPSEFPGYDYRRY
ncbi:hypothetical protein BDR04DRAFT_768773 [Suillus decipiens]|nr:hypothetical protein BDR04DRAFT_768773 [Suillus decipiens]